MARGITITNAIAPLISSHRNLFLTIFLRYYGEME